MRASVCLESFFVEYGMSYHCAGKTRSVYIHWPFCPYKCHFCPFVAIAGQDRFMKRYHEALVKEIEQFAAQYTSPLALDTIFFGGGTPSTYPNDLLLDMFGRLKTIFILNPEIEVTIEVNPGTVHDDQLPLWKEIGINRLSIGVQGLKDTVLNELNRRQSAADVFRLLDRAQYHFNNISVDLILGLPGVSEQEWKELLQQVVMWPITHVSIYFLTVHEDTPLYFKVAQKQIALPDDESIVNLYFWSVQYLACHGFEQYEISNFSKKGFQSRHNSMYWERKPYKGFGIGACSFDGKVRSQTQKNLMKYMTSMEQNTDITIFTEKLSEEQMFLERMMLGLRRTQGVDVDELMSPLISEQQEKIKTVLAGFEQHEFIKRSGNRIALTPKGLAVQNEIIVQLSI